MGVERVSRLDEALRAIAEPCDEALFHSELLLENVFREPPSSVQAQYYSAKHADNEHTHGIKLGLLSKDLTTAGWTKRNGPSFLRRKWVALRYKEGKAVYSAQCSDVTAHIDYKALARFDRGESSGICWVASP